MSFPILNHVVPAAHNFQWIAQPEHNFVDHLRSRRLLAVVSRGEVNAPRDAVKHILVTGEDDGSIMLSDCCEAIWDKLDTEPTEPLMLDPEFNLGEIELSNKLVAQGEVQDSGSFAVSSEPEPHLETREGDELPEQAVQRLEEDGGAGMAHPEEEPT